MRERLRRVARRVARRAVRIAAASAVTVSALLGAASAALAQVTLTPDASQGPGGPQLQQLVNWGAGMGLSVCLGALVYHTLSWVSGSRQHNMARVQSGKEGVGHAALAAGLIAGGAAIINFAVSLGGAIK
jgi:hypothetical protein